MSIDDAVRGKIVDSTKPHFFYLQKPMPHSTSRISGVNATDHRNLFNNRQNFVLADFHGDGVGVAVRHQPSRRAVARHAKTP